MAKRSSSASCSLRNRTIDHTFFAPADFRNETLMDSYRSDHNPANSITVISPGEGGGHVKDPVCGQDIEREAAVTWSYEEELYYF